MISQLQAGPWDKESHRNGSSGIAIELTVPYLSTSRASLFTLLLRPILFHFSLDEAYNACP